MRSPLGYLVLFLAMLGGRALYELGRARLAALRLTWPLWLLGSKLKCRLGDRHRNGSPAWRRLTQTVDVAGFRPTPMFFCRHCGMTALLDNAHPRVARFADVGVAAYNERHRMPLRSRVRVALLAAVLLVLAVLLTTGGAP